MFVKVGHQEYAVSFRHDTEGTPIFNTKGKIIHREDRHTMCIIKEIDGTIKGDVVGVGYSKCHPEDFFVKETGRMFALLKALSDAEFSREAKQIVCNAYKNRSTTKS